MERNRRHRLLLIEDNEDDAALTARALRAVDSAVDLEVCPDGSAAVRRLFEPSAPLPDLVLLDLKLPFVDGLEILRRVREDRRTAALPVVALTTSLEERDLREAYRLGVNSYLRKPVDYCRFEELIRELTHYWLVLNEYPHTVDEEADHA